MGRDRARPSIFPLQASADFGTFSDVRMFVAFLTLFIGVFPIFAQEQESKLVNRLLKPNTSLANSAQNKKFVATGVNSFEKRIPARAFYSQERTLTKTFSGEQTFTPRQFAARHFRAGDSSANLATRSQLTKNDKIISTPPTPGTRVAPESAASSPVREFAGNRPFLDRGKSEKALAAHHTPLTIEQVRELLNKSK
jgi:hypothetical protein